MKKKILHHTSIMIIFAVLVTFLAASVVTYSKLNTYMQRGVREEAQYICLAMDEYGDSFLTKKLRTVSSSRVTLIRKDGTVLYDSEASPKKLANHSDRPEFIQAEKNGKSESIRYSETFAKKTFYYAVKLDDGNVLRVGKTVDSIYSTWISSLAVLGLLMLLVLILRACIHAEFKQRPRSRKVFLIDNLFEYIHAHLTEEITLDDLEKQFFVSKYHILREFKKATGQTLHGYIVKNKLELCQKYIAEGFPITEVYKLGGFGGYNHFFRAFRQEYGMTPKEYYKATLPDGRQPQRKDTK